ncbi:hypothetical protein SPD48_08025 [Pseudogracilibacillus sp. SE30717A]|uniref:hypothetical protein n=1 Tax=Pseudogracilibacillus sp. SE30717A TaxID=3098293 RepID=UPI00300E64B0
MVRWVIFSGVASGLFLGLFFKGIEMTSGIKLYTLLLNIDFLTERVFPELIEFIFHCFVSIILVAVVFFVVKRKKWRNIQIIYFTTGINLLIGGMIYPITILSDRTPELTSFIAIILWLIGHGLYGFILGVFFIFYRKKTLVNV